VRPDLQLLRDFTHRQATVAPGAADRQQRLMLLRRQAERFCSIFAKSQEAAQRVAEGREGPVLGIAERLRLEVSRHDRGAAWGRRRGH
jgi:hypothetical protein